MEKFRYTQNRKIEGFTLVEILIVIAIIGFLSLLAVGSYLEYRKISLINLAADNFVSQINQIRTKAVYGVFDKDADAVSDPECFGISFVQSAGGWDVNKFTTAYDPQKGWNGTQWEVKGCVSLDFPSNSVSFEKDSGVNVFASLYDDSGFQKNEDAFMVLFMPPKGQAVISTGSATSLSNTKKLTTILRYGTNSSSKYQSGFALDLNSGQASKLSYEDLDEIPDELLNQ